MGRLAAIDVGSTSVHLLVADVDERGVVSVADESVFAGLGEAIAAGGLLGPRARELDEVLRRYARQATDLGATGIVMLGTAPFRRAPDAARVLASLAVAVHVLTAQEEALLTLLGATAGRSLGGDVALVDIGGGSTEVVLAGPDRPPSVVAVPVGAAALAGRHVTEDPPTPPELAAMHAAARDAVATLPPATGQAVLAVGGSADNLARIAGSQRLTRGEVESVLERLAGMSAGEASVAFGIRVARARLLPAGAAILLAILERWGIESVEATGAGLREGAVIALAAAGTGWRDRLPGLAEASRRGDAGPR